MQYHLNPPPQGPLARLVASVIAVFVLVGAVMLGMVAFLIIAGVALVAGIVIWLRVAWIKRRLKKQVCHTKSFMSSMVKILMCLKSLPSCREKSR